MRGAGFFFTSADTPNASHTTDPHLGAEKSLFSVANGAQNQHTLLYHRYERQRVVKPGAVTNGKIMFAVVQDVSGS